MTTSTTCRRRLDEPERDADRRERRPGRRASARSASGRGAGDGLAASAGRGLRAACGPARRSRRAGSARRAGAPRPRRGRDGGWRRDGRARRSRYARRAAGCGRRCGIGRPLSGVGRRPAAARLVRRGRGGPGRRAASAALAAFSAASAAARAVGQLLAGARLEVAHLGPLGGLRVALDGAVGQHQERRVDVGPHALVVRLLRQRRGRGDGLQLRLEVILHIGQLAGLAVESARLELLVLQRGVQQQQPGHAQPEGRDEHDEERQPRHPPPRGGQRPQDGRVDLAAGRADVLPGRLRCGLESAHAPTSWVGSAGVLGGSAHRAAAGGSGSSDCGAAGRRRGRRPGAGRTRRAGWRRPRPRSGAAHPWSAARSSARSSGGTTGRPRGARSAAPAARTCLTGRSSSEW